MGVGPGQVATNCKVWGNQKAYTYGGITITHKAGIESMSWSGSQNYITGWAYEKTNSSIAEGKIGARAELYDGAGLLINSTKPIWNAAGEKDVGATQPHQGKKQQRGIKAIRGKSVENRTRQSDTEDDFRKRVGEASWQLHRSRNNETERDDGGKRGDC